MHASPKETGKWLGQVVRGYFQYHAIPGNWDRLKAYRNDVLRMWFQTLRRRSQRSRLSWDRFREALGSLLPPVQILQAYPAVRFDAKYAQIQGKNRVR
jgi:RNA-directed DNA polymerase